MSRPPLSRPLARIIGAVSFGAVPLAVVFADLQGGGTVASAAVPLALLAGIPALAGAATFPSALARGSRLHAAARAGGIAFVTLALLAAAAWLAARTDLSTLFNGWIYAIALVLASPTGIAAAIVAALLWRPAGAGAE